MYRLLPWFPALWEAYTEILQKKRVGRKKEPLSRQRAGGSRRLLLPRRWLQFTGGDKSRYQKNIRAIRILKNTGAGREKCHKRRTGNSCGVCRVGRAAKCF